MTKIAVPLALLTAVGSTSALAQGKKPQTTSEPMGFEQCLATIRGAAADLGVAPINVVETRDLRMVRFNTVDGTVLITCSRADQKMAITFTPK